MSFARIVVAALLCLSSLASLAQAAPIRDVAVLSLAGDTLALHAHRYQVGSRTEGSPVEVRPVDGAVFDQMAIIAARTTLLKVLPDAKPRLMTTEDKGLYSAQNDMFEHPDRHAEDREYLKSLLKAQGVSHAIVISKFRSVAAIKLLNETVGSGTLEGLGFYVDDMIETLNRADDTRSRGMIAPFAYVRVRLVDAETLNVVREATSKQSTIITHPSADSSGMDTFGKMSSADKMQNVRSTLEYAMEAILPGILAQ